MATRLSRWQRSLDRWFPTVVRYVGVGGAVYAALTKDVALITGSIAMIMFKTVYANGEKD